ncbi:hypothetical protein ML462_01150 [Gramella lutea]|uniref:Uncharacterized protein n=1 Tax=Christiangramia lutea TaxID=1607951 RepID=A0A9X1V0T1_9FLAO|nr:hypothetical protein [Christiangramia lutea]MCH4821765.1 hypothetical protein [Christiangramia lutea]
MKKIVLTLLFIPGVFYSQTYYSSETKYYEPKEREQIERTIEVGTDTITITTKATGVTDIQKLVIKYSREGKMNRIGKAMIYECLAANGPFMYDVGVQLKDNVK